MSLALSRELEKFHTLREVADLLGYEKSSTYNLVNEVRSRCVKIGRGKRSRGRALQDAYPGFHECEFGFRLNRSEREQFQQRGQFQHNRCHVEFRSNRKSSDVRPDRLIQSTKAVRFVSVISNCTGIEVFCCTTIARAATRSR
jgi:hypothetical protein